MTWLIFIAGILCTYAVSLMISKLSGPGGIFRKLRNAPPRKSSLHDGLVCPICSGTWVAAIIATYFWWIGYVPGVEWPLWCFGMAGANALMHLFDPI